ncbi:ankyrin repeat domain-containing protein [Mesorhizobium waimense]|uniref:Ankyrin repeat domain-containing protein n=1 Tax=Mesorhizobium waimense TaxID=1300307 RepID=A0A3A5KF39_9HYPH|nr:ankyrin repeat domain-containing protein [Mesorhizobium waimense]
MIKRARIWVIRASWVHWLFTLPAQASNLADLVRNGDVAAVTSALDNGAAINEIDGVTALYIACEDGNVDLAELLINRGADVNLPVSWQRTPLYAANKGGYADIVKLLLNNGANPNQLAKSQTPLHGAAEKWLPSVRHLSCGCWSRCQCTDIEWKSAHTFGQAQWSRRRGGLLAQSWRRTTGHCADFGTTCIGKR